MNGNFCSLLIDDFIGHRGFNYNLFNYLPAILLP